MTNKRKSILESEIELVIPFHDVDLMEFVWHGHYSKYFEIARTTLLERINYNHKEMYDSGYAWPIVELKIRYAQPATLGQKLLVLAPLKEYEMRLKIDYLVSDKRSGQRLTRGHTIQVAVDLSNRELQLAFPDVLTKRIDALR